MEVDAAVPAYADERQDVHAEPLALVPEQVEPERVDAGQDVQVMAESGSNGHRVAGANSLGFFA